jgi:hypothetical protein
MKDPARMQQQHKKLRHETTATSGKKENEILRQTLEVEVIKLTVWSSTSLQKTGVRTLWRSQPHPNERKAY